MSAACVSSVKANTDFSRERPILHCPVSYSGIDQSSPAVGNAGRVFVGSHDADHNVYAFNPPGSLAWSYRTGSEMDSSPAIGSDGRLYVGSDDQNLYCFTDASSTTPTLMPPLPPTPTPIPPLAVEPGPLTAGEQFTLDLSLTQDLTRAFDLYLIADTPYGPYTVFLDGRIAAGIEPLYCNVPGYAAPYSATVRPGAKIPASMAGATVTFYLATVEAGKIPPVASLQELGPASPYVMTFDKAQALVN